MKKLLLILTAVSLASAQQTSPPPPVQSPDVHSDGRVTFRLRAPAAQQVVVNVEGSKGPLAMQKDAYGVWSATTDALAPERYSYSFQVDGVRTLDPMNSDIVPNLLSPSNSVQVPGSRPLPWEMSDIPHGLVHHHFYHSSIVGDNRDFYVYTPPGYDPNGATKYPVLYLLHGYSDEANGWSMVGKANLILDSLIAENKAKPMIVVMPLGYGAPEIVQRTPAFGAPFNNAALRDKNFTNFSATLIDEVIPAVESQYRVDPSRDARAIAGLSMGGSETLLTGLNRLEKFSWIGAFSSGGLSPDFALDFPQLNSSANARLHLLWIACGTEDHLITINRNLIAWLKSRDIHVNQIETPGMHTWMVWRNDLIQFAPLLFRPDTNVSPAPASE